MPSPRRSVLAVLYMNTCVPDLVWTALEQRRRRLQTYPGIFFLGDSITFTNSTVE